MGRTSPTYELVVRVGGIGLVRIVQPMTAMTTRDGRWRIEAAGTGSVVIWYRLIGPATDRVLPSTQALLAELRRHGLDVADLGEAATEVTV